MSNPSPIIGPDDRLDRAAPSQAFMGDLRAELLRAHAAGAATPLRRLRLRWLSLPAFGIAAALAFAFIFLPKGPLNADQFLERAEAEMNSFAELGDSGIRYTKQRMYFPAIIYGTGSDAYTNVSPGLPAGKPPYIQELWSGIVDGNRWVMMDRRSDEQGNRQQQSLSFYRKGDEMMIYAENGYYWWPKAGPSTPVCVGLEMSDAETKIFKERIGEDSFTESGSRITTYVPDEDSDLIGQFYAGDGAKSVAALRKLVKKGTVVEVPVQESEKGKVRTFRSDTFYTVVGEDGKPAGTPEVTGYILYSFSTADYKFMREERYSIFEGKDYLDQRTEYLEEKMLPQSAAAELFDPKKQDLFDPFQYLPVTRKQLEETPAESRCYYNGKWLGNDPFALFNLPEDVRSKMQMVLLARIYSGRPAPTNSQGIKY